jgi:hypothetical protein
VTAIHLGRVLDSLIVCRVDQIISVRPARSYLEGYGVASARKNRERRLPCVNESLGPVGCVSTFLNFSPWTGGNGLVPQDEVN